MVLTPTERLELELLKNRELEVWTQLQKWVEDRCNTYDRYYKGDSNE